MVEAGENCKIVVRNKTSDDAAVLPVEVANEEEIFVQNFYLSSAIQRYYIDAHRTEISNTIFSLPYPGIDISGLPEVRRADIVNLHWVARYQSPVTLHKIFVLGKPVVWTLHDQWAFTGGCHYSAGCEKYRTDCSRCPLLADDPFDIAAAILKDKRDLFKDANLTIVTPSRWLAECAKESALFKDLRVEVIPNSLETDVFTPVPKAEAKERLGAKADDILLLFGAEQGNEKRKGFHELVGAIRHCMNDTAFRDLAVKGLVKILCLGKASAELESIGLPVITLGYVTEDDKIREVYSAADLYVLPSLEDNLPNTMIEALSCATPVVAFKTGGIPDVVVEGETGMLAATGDGAALGRAIVAMVGDPTRRSRMGLAGREKMVAHFSLSAQAKKYLELYKELLGKASAAGHAAAVEGERTAAPTIDTTLGAHFASIYEGVQIKSLREAAPALQKDLIACRQAKAEKNTKLQQLHAEMTQTVNRLQERDERIAQLEPRIEEIEGQFRRKCEELIEKDNQLRIKCIEVVEKDEAHQKIHREREKLEKELAQARARIDEMLNSWSWKITRPLRHLGRKGSQGRE